MTHKSYGNGLIPRERMLCLNLLLPPDLAPPQNLQSVARHFSIDSKRQQQTLSRHCCWEKKIFVSGVPHSDSLPASTSCPLWGTHAYLTPFPCLASKTEGTWEHNVTDVNFTWPHWYNRTQQKTFLIYMEPQSWVIPIFCGSNLSLWRDSGQQVNVLYRLSVICSQTSASLFQRL